MEVDTSSVVNEVEANQDLVDEKKYRPFQIDPSLSTIDNLVAFIMTTDDDNLKKEAQKLLDKILMGDKPIEYSFGLLLRNMRPLLIYLPFIIGLGILAAILSPDATDVLSKMFSFLTSLVWIGILILLANKVMKGLDSYQKKA